MSYIDKVCNIEEIMHFFSENQGLTPVTPNDPRLTYDPGTDIKGLKLLYMFESYGLAIYNGRVTAFFVKMTF